MGPHRVIELSATEIDRVEPLWKSMVAHHREVAGAEWQVRSEQEAWERRRAEYLAWLGWDEGWMFAAAPNDEPDGALAGYAMLLTRRSGATWDMGEEVGELESLAVAPALRGQGIGTILVDACRGTLRDEGIAFWGVSVVEANDGATRLYARAGFRPYYRSLMAEVG